MSLQEFGEFISQKLIERKLKRKELALKLGVGQNTISGWISGNHRPEAKYLPALAEALGISEWELLRVLTNTSQPDKLEQVAEMAARRYGRKRLKSLLAQLSAAGMNVIIKEEDINPNLVAVEQVQEMENAISALLKAQNSLLTSMDNVGYRDEVPQT